MTDLLRGVVFERHFIDVLHLRQQCRGALFALPELFSPRGGRLGAAAVQVVLERLLGDLRGELVPDSVPHRDVRPHAEVGHALREEGRSEGSNGLAEVGYVLRERGRG